MVYHSLNWKGKAATCQKLSWQNYSYYSRLQSEYSDNYREVQWRTWESNPSSNTESSPNICSGRSGWRRPRKAVQLGAGNVSQVWRVLENQFKQTLECLEPYLKVIIWAWDCWSQMSSNGAHINQASRKCNCRLAITFIDQTQTEFRKSNLPLGVLNIENAIIKIKILYLRDWMIFFPKIN